MWLHNLLPMLLYTKCFAPTSKFLCCSQDRAKLLTTRSPVFIADGPEAHPHDGSTGICEERSDVAIRL
jgi:hypothetical protein